MKKSFACLLIAASVAFAGCNNNSTPGGPGATSNRGDNKPVVGRADDTFTLDPPNLATKVKQGESKAVSIGIKRGKNFDQDVTLKFSDLPKGVTIDPASPVIKHGDTEVKLTVKAADDAALGDFAVKATGHPTKGSDASNELRITVDKK
jgi:uncharacterized membrane protein